MSSRSSLRASPRIACYGTAFLARVPVELTILEQRIGPGVPQFSSPRLDVSFLASCARFLANPDASATDNHGVDLKRVAGNNFRLSKSIHLYECSAKLCGLLAALTEQRANEIACNWYDNRRPAAAATPESNGRTRRRLEILKNLAILAKQAMADHKTLMLRVEYRKQRQPDRE